MESFTTQLTDRATLTLGGADARSFLQDLITGDMRRVTPTSGIYAFLLSPQGKYLHDLFIVKTSAEPEAFLIDCAAAQRDDLIKRLTMFKLRSAVTLEASDRPVFASWPSGAEAGDFTVDGDQIIDGRADGLGLRSYAPCKTTANAADYHAHRRTLGVPDPQTDFIANKTMLMDAGIDGQFGIAWDKGCFVGQEPTARMKYRGLVKRLLVSVGTAAPLNAGDALMLGERKLGEASSTAFALIHRDALQAEDGSWQPQTLTGPDGQLVTPLKPNWWDRSSATQPKEVAR